MELAMQRDHRLEWVGKWGCLGIMRRRTRKQTLLPHMRLLMVSNEHHAECRRTEKGYGPAPSIFIPIITTMQTVIQTAGLVDSSQYPIRIAAALRFDGNR